MSGEAALEFPLPLVRDKAGVRRAVGELAGGAS